jgi:hypothetical protein
MSPKSKAKATEAPAPSSRGISPWWLFLVVALIVIAGWLGWQAVVLKQNVNELQDQVTQLKTEADQLRLQSGAVGEQKSALATALVPVIEEWSKIAQVQVDSGNRAGAQASVERAEKFLTMAEGLDTSVPLAGVKAAIDQVKAALAGEEAKEGGTEALP